MERITFFTDMINIKVFDSNFPKIDKKLYQSIDIYYIGYITIEKISLNHLYLIIGEVDEFIEEKNGG